MQPPRLEDDDVRGPEEEVAQAEPDGGALPKQMVEGSLAEPMVDQHDGGGEGGLSYAPTTNSQGNDKFSSWSAGAIVEHVRDVQTLSIRKARD